MTDIGEWYAGFEVLAPPRPLSNSERLAIWRAKMSLYCNKDLREGQNNINIKEDLK